MEFSYQISEKDYVRATKMARYFKRPTVLKIVLFWSFIVICLVLLFGVVNDSKHYSVSRDSDSEPVTQPVPVKQNLFENVMPAAIVIGVLVFSSLYWIPNAARRQYRKDTNCHGTVTVALDAQSFSLRSTVGMSFQSSWNVFDGWREKNGIVLLRYPSGTFQFVIVRDLP